MKHSPKPEELLPLSPAVFHVLLALVDGEQHGYAIMREVNLTSEGGIRMGAGTLYGTIGRMLKSGLIEECEGPRETTSHEERRRYYRLTNFGRKVLGAESQRLEALMLSMRRKKLIGAKGVC